MIFYYTLALLRGFFLPLLKVRRSYSVANVNLHTKSTFNNFRIFSNGTNYSNCEFSRFSMSDTKPIRRTTFDNCNFDNLCMHNITFERCTFYNCSFRNIELRQVFFKECKFLNTRRANLCFEMCLVVGCKFPDFPWQDVSRIDDSCFTKCVGVNYAQVTYPAMGSCGRTMTAVYTEKGTYAFCGCTSGELHNFTHSMLYGNQNLRESRMEALNLLISILKNQEGKFKKQPNQ